MKLIGMMPVRNEDWVLGLSLRVALMWCDEVVVLLHACTDFSEDIARAVGREHPGRVHITRNMVGTWKEFEHRQDMLDVARAHGATHLAIVDADEVVTGNAVGDLKNYCLSMPAGVIMHLPGYNLRNSVNQYHENGVWGNRWFSTAFADDPALGWEGEGFHHREPHGRPLRPVRLLEQGLGGVMHLWGASYPRLVAKHACYKLTERILDPSKDVMVIDREYSQAIHGRGAMDNPRVWDYADVPKEWWAPYAHLMEHLYVDAVPWQIAECKRLVEKHGVEITKGLDLFGVV